MKNKGEGKHVKVSIAVPIRFGRYFRTTTQQLHNLRMSDELNEPQETGRPQKRKRTPKRSKPADVESIPVFRIVPPLATMDTPTSPPADVESIPVFRIVPPLATTDTPTSPPADVESIPVFSIVPPLATTDAPTSPPAYEPTIPIISSVESLATRNTPTSRPAYEPTIPIISRVYSLATRNSPSACSSVESLAEMNASSSTLQSPCSNVGDNSSQAESTATRSRTYVVIRPAPIPPQRNVGTMCKLNMKTKGVSCKPTTCDAEVQTDEVKKKTAIVPIPVPIYVPAPMGMYSIPFPQPFPFPLPIPVPIFIPTTRNSAKGIMKEIKKIQDKTPTDPSEAELLTKAGDKKDEQTSSESEEEDTARKMKEL